MAEFSEWYDGKHVNEVKFCEGFLREHPMKSVNGTFFTLEGRVTDEDRLRRDIYELLKPYFSAGLGKRANNLLEALRLEAYAPDLPIQRDRIHVTNGTLFLDGTFTPEREFCRNRLPVAYNPGATTPTTWLRSSTSCSTLRTSRRCRSSWATASCPRRRVRKCSC